MDNESPLLGAFLCPWTGGMPRVQDAWSGDAHGGKVCRLCRAHTNDFGHGYALMAWRTGVRKRVLRRSGDAIDGIMMPVQDRHRLQRLKGRLRACRQSLCIAHIPVGQTPGTAIWNSVRFSLL